ncbi:MAG: thiamine-phosphate kinase [Burkholderiales bacterium]|jgi:thiamine-monophosphate kinase|nr:thiamine-phosphate kinase [Burkholderiales bacterium]
MNEFELINRFFKASLEDHRVLLGIGDDAALIAPIDGNVLAVSTDTLNEGRHFFSDVPPFTLGHKVMAVNLSDMAAMGAVPRFALLSGSLPDADFDWLSAFSRGFFALASKYRVSVIGGDTTRAAQGGRSFTVTIIGDVPEALALKRSGATTGDDIWVSGTIGDAALALRAMHNDLCWDAPDLARLRARLETPSPRVELGMALRGLASSAIDVSDGLTGDLSHVLKGSGVGATVFLSALPADPVLLKCLADEKTRSLALSCALAGGDDYELCFTAPPENRAAIAALSTTLNLRLSRIGVITDSQKLTVVDEQQNPISPLPASFHHF